MTQPAGEPTETMTVADQLVDVLLDWGVKDVFICPGSTEAAFLHAVAARADLNIVLTTHESITVSMADGMARATGRPTVAYLHANVGLTNGLSHLYAAQLAGSPVVVLTGLKQQRIQGRGGFTTAPHIRDFVRQYTKWSWQSLEAEAVSFDVARALQVSSTAPQGPTWVGLSQDLAEARVPSLAAPSQRLAVRTGTRAPRDVVVQTAQRLREARRPILIAGSDIARSHAGLAALRDLAELLDAPVFAEDRRAFEQTVFATSHRQYAGLYDVGRASVRDADLAVFVGARCFLEFETPTRPDVPPNAVVVHVHPDGAEVGKIYGADLGAVADSATFLIDLLDAIGSHGGVSDENRFRSARQEHLAIVDSMLAEPEPRRARTCSVAEVMGCLAEALTDEHVVVGDATTSGKALIHAVEKADVPIYTTSSGSLGWGVGAAMGIQLARPDKRVLAVCGDGVFQFGLPGLWTAVRYRIPVTFLVINNAAYAAVGAAIRRYAGGVTDRERDLTVDLSGPRLAAVAEGFGVTAQTLTDPAELITTLAKLSASDGPQLLEIATDPLDLGP